MLKNIISGNTAKDKPLPKTVGNGYGWRGDATICKLTVKNCLHKISTCFLSDMLFVFKN